MAHTDQSDRAELYSHSVEKHHCKDADIQIGAALEHPQITLCLEWCDLLPEKCQFALGLL